MNSHIRRDGDLVLRSIAAQSPHNVRINAALDQYSAATRTAQRAVASEATAAQRVQDIAGQGVLWDQPRMATAIARRRSAADAARQALAEVDEAAGALGAELLIAAAA